MIEAPAGVPKRGGDVFRFQIRVVLKNLPCRHAGAEHIEDVNHANSHTADARPPPALSGIHRDPFEKLGHGDYVLVADHPKIHCPRRCDTPDLALEGRPLGV